MLGFTLCIFAVVSTGLWWFYFMASTEYLVDEFRQHLFNLRDRFFTEAPRNGIGYEHVVYGMFRSRLNRLIRYAHQVSFVKTLLFFLISMVGKDESMATYEQRFQEKLEQLSTQQKRFMSEYVEETAWAVVRYILLSSWLLRPLVIPLLLLTRALRIIIRKYGAIKKISNHVVEAVEHESDLIGLAEAA